MTERTTTGPAGSGPAVSGPARRTALGVGLGAVAATVVGASAAEGAEAFRPGRGGGRLTVTSEHFGTTKGGRAVRRWRFGNGALRVWMLDYGATIQRLETPDRHGRKADVVLGQRTLAEYEALDTYFGATIGRYANRIAKGRFTLDGTTHQIPVNDPGTAPVNALHGGPDGFDDRVWDAVAIRRDDRVGVAFSLVSPDGDQGFPGTLRITVEYTVDAHARLRIDYRATTDQATVVNFTNHAYFNLAGESSGDVYDHRVTIPANRFTPIDATSIPLGPQRAVSGSPFDFRTPHTIGSRIRVPDQQILNALGYDHNWVLSGAEHVNGLRLAARVTEPTTRRALECWTDQPGVQFYTGNFLTGKYIGPGNRTYRQGAGFTLETQHFPDSPNQPSYPSTVLRPGDTFRSRTRFDFGTA